MGAGDSKDKSKVECSINHPNFSNAKFLKVDNKRMIETVMGVQEKEYNTWKNTLSKENPSPRYLLLPVKHDFSTKGLCGSSGTLNLQFEDFPYLLTEEIHNRKGSKGKFQEQELWYLLYALMNAKMSTRPPNSKVGDIRPQNIFINDEGEVKVANLLSWPRAQTNYSKSFENQVTYLAPEELKQLEMGKIQQENNDKSQIFSMGLTLLSTINLTDLSNLYDLKGYRFDSQSLQQNLEEFWTNRAYSDIFKATVTNMCSVNDSNRIRQIELWDWIIPHEESIRARQNFVFPSAPDQIHRNVMEVREFNSRQIQPSSENRFSYSGQPLSFPPPIIRSSSPKNMTIDTSQPVESIYIPNPNRNTAVYSFQNNFDQQQPVEGQTVDPR